MHTQSSRAWCWNVLEYSDLVVSCYNMKTWKMDVAATSCGETTWVFEKCKTMNYNITSMYYISPSVIPGSLFPALHMCSQSQIRGSITVVVNYLSGSAHLLLLSCLLPSFLFYSSWCIHILYLGPLQISFGKRQHSANSFGTICF